MWPGRTGKPSGAARSRIKRRASSLHPISGLPEIKPPQKAQAVLEPVAPRPRGGTVDTADLKSASGKPECRFESGRGHHRICLAALSKAVAVRRQQPYRDRSLRANVAGSAWCFEAADRLRKHLLRQPEHDFRKEDYERDRDQENAIDR